ncbi:hypothetical protein [Nonomuraea sp. NPDC002799]
MARSDCSWSWLLGATNRTLADALNTIDTGTAGYLAEQTEIGLGDTEARQIWRWLILMQNYRYKSEFAQMLRTEGEAIGEARGEAIGEANAVLQVLQERGIVISEPVRERVMSCVDIPLLRSWLTKSLHVTSAEQLFD